MQWVAPLGCALKSRVPKWLPLEGAQCASTGENTKNCGISEEFKVLEEEVERCGIEGACGRLREAKVAFSQAYSTRLARQTDVRTFFRGVS